MGITWRDGITTAATVIAGLVERAYFHDWGWPLVHEINWAIVAVGMLGFVCFYYGYSQDDNPSVSWSTIAYLLTIIAAGLAAAGVLTGNADYLVLLTIAAFALWFSSIIQHLIHHRESRPRHGISAT